MSLLTVQPLRSPVFSAYGGVYTPGSSWDTITEMNAGNASESTPAGWSGFSYAPPGNTFATSFPISGGLVKATYCTGLTGGSSPGNYYFGISDLPIVRVIEEIELSSSPRILINNTGMDKNYFMEIGAGPAENRVYTLYASASIDSDPIYSGFALQNVIAGTTVRQISSFQLVPGSRYTVTTEYKGNSAGTADGYVKQYAIAGAFDGSNIGTEIVALTGIQWTTGEALVRGYKWSSTYGGISGTIGTPPDAPANFYNGKARVIIQEPA